MSCTIDPFGIDTPPRTVPLGEFQLGEQARVRLFRKLCDVFAPDEMAVVELVLSEDRRTDHLAELFRR